MPEQITPIPEPPAKRWPTPLSLVIWGLIGFATGFVIGGLGLQISGAQGVGGATVGVRVEVFGLKLRQGVGPESMDHVIWTWGVGVLATFAVAGTAASAAVRVVAGWAGTGLVKMNVPEKFDADEYYRAGNCPWTFFAFPRVFADNAGFPPDDDAKRLFAALKRQGIPVGTWMNSPNEDSAYFACPKDAIGRLSDALSALEDRGEFEKGFCTKRTEYLFSLLGKST